MASGEAMLRTTDPVDTTSVKELLDQMKLMQDRRAAKSSKPFAISRTTMVGLNSMAQKALTQPGDPN